MPPSKYLALMLEAAPTPGNKRPASTPDGPPSKRDHPGSGPEVQSGSSALKNQMSTPHVPGAPGQPETAKSTGGSDRGAGQTSGSDGRGKSQSAVTSSSDGLFFDLSGSNELHGAIFKKVKNLTSRSKVVDFAKILNLASEEEIAAEREEDEHFLPDYVFVSRMVLLKGPLDETKLTELCKLFGVHTTPPGAPAAAATAAQ